MPPFRTWRRPVVRLGKELGDHLAVARGKL